MNSMLSKILVKTLSTISLSVIFYLILKQIIATTLFKKAKRKSNKRALTMITVITNIIKYLLIIIDILMILDLNGIDTKSLLASLGIMGVVVGFALQDLLKDIIGGAAILTEEQFSVGDNIKVGDFRGDVIYLGLKTTKIKAYTGEVKIISNRNITEVINYSTKNSKCIIDINTSYENDLDSIKLAINNICEKLTNEVQYIEEKVELLGVEELKDSSICLRVVAELPQTKNVEFKRLFLEEVVKEFKKQKLEIPYPKMEVHHE
ncbi:MAG: mechanosensitive ion channel family protein [Bacilli bacterium]|nr:mechanosensitive ion channel family protein [Bacilli bacterium]